MMIRQVSRATCRKWLRRCNAGVDGTLDHKDFAKGKRRESFRDVSAQFQASDVLSLLPIPLARTSSQNVSALKAAGDHCKTYKYL